MKGRRNGEGLARGLGIFSLGLGGTELFAPRALGRFLGVEDRTGLLRGYGLRELLAGIGILSRRALPLFVWSRVAGDAVDLGSLGVAMTRRPGAARARLWIAIGAVAAVTALDLLAGVKLSRRRGLFG